MATKYVDVDGHAIYVHYAGATTLPDVMPDFSRGRKIVFLHAAGRSGSAWTRQLERLGAAHSPLAPDMPGHGRSSGVEGLMSIRDYAGFLVRILDTLKIKSAVIAGHSMGGATAMDFAARYPDRVEALVLVSTAAKFSIPEDRLKALWSVMMGRAPQAFTTEIYSPRTVKENFDTVREGWMEQIKTDPRVRYTDVKACSEVDLRGALASINKPTLILVGADDNATTPADSEAIHAGIKGSRVEVIADAGHALPWERHSEVNSAIESFLSGLK
ncbi:MAG TPA: alpha/beta fold hydrolase [Candidatus Binataceae bacterium]|nr:alpha/beta fold hydrolase [Candidatus Binataceae bacterium]